MQLPNFGLCALSNGRWRVERGVEGEGCVADPVGSHTGLGLLVHSGVGLNPLVKGGKHFRSTTTS